VSFLRHVVEKRSTTTTFNDAWGRDVDWGGSHTTDSGIAVSPMRALQSITVWACVRLISGSIAALPTGCYVRNGDVRETYKPRPIWMYQPNPEQVSLVFWEQIIAALLLYGNGYAYIVRDNNGDVLEMWPIHPDLVSPRRDGPNRKLIYHATDIVTGNTYELTPGVDIIHIPGYSLPGSVVGLNPIAYAKQCIGLGLATEEQGARFFSQGSTASVVLEAEKEVGEAALKRTALGWRKSHTGLKNSHFPAILEGGLTAKTLSIPNDQAQFLETRGFQRSEIASFFAVTPHMIGDVDRSTSWGSGVESMAIDFVKFTLQTWIIRIEQACNILFPPGSRAFMKFNLDGLLRGDQLSRFTAYNMALDGGYKNPDEVRALEDDAPIPGGKGQGFRQPLNFGPLGETTPKGASQ